MIYSFNFADKDLYKDFRCKVKDRKIGNPNKQKVLERVPFSNVTLDFSEVYGEQVYDDRLLSYTVSLIDKADRNQPGIYHIEMMLNNWLMPGMRSKLYDDVFPNYYFIAEVQNGPDFKRLLNTGELQIDFVAYPFKISKYAEGNDDWNSFDFIFDIAQKTHFTINGTRKIILDNTGVVSSYPKLIASSDMTIETESGQVFKVSKGINDSDALALYPGKTEFIVTGEGELEFKFYKEMI